MGAEKSVAATIEPGKAGAIKRDLGATLVDIVRVCL